MDFEIEQIRKPADEISSLGIIVPLIFSLTNIFRPKVLSENTKINWFLTPFLIKNGIFDKKLHFTIQMYHVNSIERESKSAMKMRKLIFGAKFCFLGQS